MKINAEGKTEFERFSNVVKKVLSVSKEELNRRMAADPRGHEKSAKNKAASKKKIGRVQKTKTI